MRHIWTWCADAQSPVLLKQRKSVALPVELLQGQRGCRKSIKKNVAEHENCVSTWIWSRAALWTCPTHTCHAPARTHSRSQAAKSPKCVVDLHCNQGGKQCKCSTSLWPLGGAPEVNNRTLQLFLTGHMSPSLPREKFCTCSQLIIWCNTCFEYANI